MKPFYNIGLVNAFKPQQKVIRLFRRLSIYIILFLTISIFILFFNQQFILFIIFSICVISMLPLKYAAWSGFFDMNIILTCFTSINYGLPAGLFVGNASLIGLILSGDIDNSLIFDWILSVLVAFLAFISPLTFVPTVTGITILYIAGYVIFHIFCDTLEFTNISWAFTNICWNLLLLWQILPILSKIWL